jgi:uncharacterized protein with HEPN domain
VTRADRPRQADKIIGDLLDAADAAAEIVSRGKDAWQQDRLLRLAGEAVISRIGDAAAKLPEQVQAAMPAVPWDDIHANRVLVAHIYHRIDYEILWETLARDVPSLASEIRAWRSAQHTASPRPEAEREA